MAKFLDRVKTYSYLDRQNGTPGKSGNFTYVAGAPLNDPIYLEMVVSPETLDITAYKTNISDFCGATTGGYEVYQTVAGNKWDIDLTQIIGSSSVMSRVNKNILEDLSVAPEYEDSTLKELLLKTTESIGHFMGWDNLYIASDVAGEKPKKPSPLKKAKSAFEQLKERLTGHTETVTEHTPINTNELLQSMGYVDVNPASNNNASFSPMVGTPKRNSTLQPDILETLTGTKLNGKPITESDNFSPRFQFVYRILDKDLTDLMASHSLHY